MNRRKNISVKKLLALSFALVFVIPLVCNVFVMLGERRVIKKSIRDSNSALMNQISYVFESYLESVSVIGRQIAEGSYLTAAVQSGEASAAKCAEISDYLKKYKEMSPIIDDICLYLSESDTVVTTRFFGTSESFFNEGYSFGENDFVKWKTRFLEEYKYRGYERSFKSSGGKNLMAFMQSIPVDYRGAVEGQLIIMLNCDDIIDAMAKRNIENSSSMFVINNYGEILISTGGAQRIDMGVFKQMENRLSGSFNASVGGENVMVQYLRPSSLNHTYVIYTPEKVFMKDIRRLNTVTMISYMACLLLGAAVIMYISRRTYSPIENLVKLLTGGENEKNVNEFEIIRRDITAKRREVTELKKTLERENLIKIIRGEYTAHDAAISGFEDRERNGRFTFMNVNVKKCGKSMASSLEEEYDTVCFILLNVISELLEGRYTVKCVNMPPSDFLFIISDIELVDGSNDDSAEEFASAARELERLMSSEFETEIVITVSEKHIGFAGFKKCYGEIKELKIFSLENPSMSIVSYREHGKAGSAENYFCLYSEENENGLINCCRSGQKERLAKLISEIFEQNRAVTEKNAEFRRYLYYDIYGTYLRLSGELSRGGKGAACPPNYSDRVPGAELCSYLTELFCRLCDETEGAYENSNAICEAVKAYVKENYMCYDLGLEKIAESFNISPKYLSNLFKRTENIRLTDFISIVRMEEAKKLLLTTRLSAAEIAGKVGYTSDIAFSRFFKKKEGVPPGVYRTINRNY